MKRKLFLSLLVSFVIAVLFSVIASAEVTIYDDAPVKTNITVTTDDIVVFSDGFSCLAGYISSDLTETTNGWAGALTVRELFDFKYINEKTGKNYGFGDIVSVDIPQGVTYIGGYGITGATNIKKISFPDTITGFGGYLLMNCTSLEECIFEHDANDGLETLPPAMFANCPRLKAVSLPDCITTFGWKQQTLDGEYFKGCTDLGAIYLPKNLQIMYGQTDDKAVFGMLDSIYFVNEPFTYDNIPAKPDVYYFPSGLTTMSGTPFTRCKNLNNVLVFPQSLTSITRGWELEGAETGNGDKPIIVMLGDMTAININGWNVKAVYFANPNDINGSTAGVSGNATTYYCYAENNTNHLTEKTVYVPAKCEVDGASISYCFCGCEISKEVDYGTALTHDYDYLKGNGTLLSFTYESYLTNGTKLITCENCDKDCEFVASALFACLGYSGTQFGNRGLLIGFAVNRNAIEDYKISTNKEFNYGLFAGMASKIGSNDAVNEKGEAINGAISVDYTSRSFDIIEFKIAGINDDATQSAKLIMGVYVICGKDGEKEISYLQASESSGESKYSTICYNDLFN